MRMLLVELMVSTERTMISNDGLRAGPVGGAYEFRRQVVVAALRSTFSIMAGGGRG